MSMHCWLQGYISLSRVAVLGLICCVEPYNHTKAPWTLGPLRIEQPVGLGWLVMASFGGTESV